MGPRIERDFRLRLNREKARAGMPSTRTDRNQLTERQAMAGGAVAARSRLRLFAVPLAAIACMLLLGPLAAVASAFDQLVSTSPDRSSASQLNGKIVSGNIYVFVSPNTGATQVKFYLDDPTRSGSPIRVENAAPWDFAGTAGDNSANPYNTSALSNASHSITAAIALSAGGNQIITSNFTVSNGGGGG